MIHHLGGIGQSPGRSDFVGQQSDGQREEIRLVPAQDGLEVRRRQEGLQLPAARRLEARPVGWGQEVPAGTAAGQGQRIVRPAGANGPTFLTTANFQAILRWNQSDFFALAVGLLSDKIAASQVDCPIPPR